MKQKKKIDTTLKPFKKKKVRRITPSKTQKTFSKKVLIAIAILFVMLFLIVFFSSKQQTLRGNAAQPSPSPIIPTFGPIGDCTTNNNCPTGTPTGSGQQLSTAPTASGATAPSVNPSQNPVMNPCISAKDAQVTAMSKHSNSSSGGFFQFILQFFQMLLQLLQQLLGGSGGTTSPGVPTPTPSLGVQPSQGVQPTGVPAPSPTPCPPSTSSSPQPSVSQPSSAPVQPTSVPVPTGGSGGGTGTTQCLSDGTTTLDNGLYTMYTNEYNSQAALQICGNGNIGFNVTQSQLNVALGGSPGAYPAIYKGNAWGQITQNSGLPVPVSNLIKGNAVTSTVDTTTVSSGIWDDAFDTFFNTTSTGNQASGGTTTEMMIWLSDNGINAGAGSPVASNVSIDGHTWNVFWSGYTLTFIAEPHITSATIDFGPFASYAISKGYITSAEYFIDVEMGFEIWTGGQGLKLNSLKVCTPAGC